MSPVAMGIAFACQLRTAPQMSNVWSALPYFSISLSLNVLLTFAIVIRLILHTRATRTALGGSGMGGLCKAIVTMLVESCALYAVSSLLVIGPWSVGSPITNFPPSIPEETQVCAFPRLQSSDRLSNVMTGWAGHRCTTHHPTSRQQERVDKQHYRFWAY